MVSNYYPIPFFDIAKLGNYNSKTCDFLFRFSLCFVTSFLAMTILLIGKTKLLSLRA